MSADFTSRVDSGRIQFRHLFRVIALEALDRVGHYFIENFAVHRVIVDGFIVRLGRTSFF